MSPDSGKCGTCCAGGTASSGRVGASLGLAGWDRKGVGTSAALGVRSFLQRISYAFSLHIMQGLPGLKTWFKKLPFFQPIFRRVPPGAI